jgi:serine O-acetyltransferase
MDYSYAGDAHRELTASYDEARAPFPTSTQAFPPQEYVREEVRLLRRLLFPRCWNGGALVGDASQVRATLDELGGLFVAGIAPYAASECTDTAPTPGVDGDDDTDVAVDADARADAESSPADDPATIVDRVFDRLPALRRTIERDVEAAYKGDPAAESYLEVIRSYPGLLAITVQRVAHALYDAGASQYARELTEYAKTQTGIDIHPGAEIGEYFFVDHGTGVVVGETTTVGDWVRLYQNVTLGALHFEEAEDDSHMLKKGYKRHPDIGDHVVIGAGSNVMGAISIGDHVSIGANSWISDDVPSHTTVYISEHPTLERKENRK